MEKQPPATWSTWTLDSWMQLQTKSIEPQNHRPHFPELLPSPQRKRCNMSVTNSSTKNNMFNRIILHHPLTVDLIGNDAWNKQWKCISNWMVTSTNVQKIGKNHRLQKPTATDPISPWQNVRSRYMEDKGGSFFCSFPLTFPPAMTRTLLHQLKASGYPSTSSKDSWLEGVVALPRQTTPKASAWH